MATVTKNSKTNEIAIFSGMARYILLRFFFSFSRTLMMIDIKMKKICSVIRSQ